MKNLIVIFSILILYSCAENNPKIEKEKIKYFYLSSDINGVPADTFKYEEVNHIDSIDELLATEYFECRGQSHIIKMYSSDHLAPTDGGILKYTFDSIGIIYSRPIWWQNYRRLYSTNDSINDLVNAAFGYMLMKKSLRGFYCDDRFTHIPEEISWEK